MECQLEQLPNAGSELSGLDRARAGARRVGHRAAELARKAAADPSRVLAKLGLIDRPPKPDRSTPEVPTPLGLRPGERVRVKTLEQIDRTLDATLSTHGLGFMPVQRAFAGGEFTVRTRVERFFDERTRRMLRLRDTVILDGVFCEPPAGGDEDYAGCNRMCFLFWKEAWLERI